MLIREAPATELTVATRVLAHAGALAEGGRLTSRLQEVVYLAARGTAARAMTPYDIAAIRLRDGLVLAGDPPDDVGRYLDAHRAAPDAASVALATDGAFVSGPSVRACALAALRRAQGAPSGAVPDAAAWRAAVEAATAAGALLGALPVRE